MKLLNPNSFAEAIFYYYGIANNEPIKKRLANIVKLHPETRQPLEKILKPAIALEKRLDSKIDYEKVLVDKYFKKLDNQGFNSFLSSVGFCLASIMLYSSVLNHLEYTASEFYKYFSECSRDERLFSFFTDLFEEGELIDNDDYSPDAISYRVEKLPLSYESKWKIISTAFTCDSCTEELLSLLLPVAKEIEAAAGERSEATEQFRVLYCEANAQMLFESYFGQKLIPVDDIEIAPLIFGFDVGYILTNRNCGILTDGSSVEQSSVAGKMLFGIARHITWRSPQDKMAKLSEKMQALAERIRLEMLVFLCSHKVCGQELCDKFKLSRSVLSYHITKLKNIGFITTEFILGKPYYAADKSEIKRTLDSFWEELK